MAKYRFRTYSAVSRPSLIGSRPKFNQFFLSHEGFYLLKKLKYLHRFLRYFGNRRTDKQTDRRRQKHYLLPEWRAITKRRCLRYFVHRQTNTQTNKQTNRQRQKHNHPPFERREIMKSLELRPQYSTQSVVRYASYIYRPPFWWEIMFLPASVCLSVCLSVTKISQELEDIFQFCFTGRVLHARGRTD